jgi:hypothetical protein
MSILEMLKLHPDVHGEVNEVLAKAARHAMFCSVMCASCADACSAEKTDMRQCIRSCMDCSDVCGTTAKLAVRRTGQNVSILRSMIETCIRACEACGEECARHNHEHCTLCAEMCRECARDCRDAHPTVQ